MFCCRILLAASIAAVGAGHALAQAPAKPDAPLVTQLTALDYIEIEPLNRKYAWALDACANDGFDYADLYTPDGAKGTSYLVYPSRNGKYVDDEHHGHDGGYQDIYVRTANGWRYKERIHVFSPQLPGQRSGVPNDKLDSASKPAAR